jgi:hypothetical protein
VEFRRWFFATLAGAYIGEALEDHHNAFNFQMGTYGKVFYFVLTEIKPLSYNFKLIRQELYFLKIENRNGSNF